MGNTIGICTDCLKEAMSSIENYTEPVKVKKEIKPLFHHPELDVTISSVADKEPEPQEVIEETTEEIPISVAEDTVTKEEPITTTVTQSNSKKKTNKKK